MCRPLIRFSDVHQGARSCCGLLLILTGEGEEQWRLRKYGHRPSFSLSHQSLHYSWISPNLVLVMSDKSCIVARSKSRLQRDHRHGVNDNANSCNSPISVAREEIPDLYAVKVSPDIQHTNCPIDIWRKRLLTPKMINHFSLFKPRLCHLYRKR